MTKRGRTPTPPGEVKPHDTIEVEGTHLFRISTVAEVEVYNENDGTYKAGWILSTYRNQVQFYFDNNADTEVMVVDESTLTHTPFD
jgi:hypothetical protein